MIPNIVRGSDPAGLVRYLFGKGRRNEHTDQHLVCASGDMFPSFDMDGRPAASYAGIGRRFDRRDVYKRQVHGYPHGHVYGHPHGYVHGHPHGDAHQIEGKQARRFMYMNRTQHLQRPSAQEQQPECRRPMEEEKE